MEARGGGTGGGRGDAGGGHLEEIRVRPDMAALVKHDSGLNGGLLSRRLSARLSFICPSPNKTRAALSDSPAAAAAGVNRPPPISSLSLPSIWAAFLSAHAEDDAPADDITRFKLAPVRLGTDKCIIVLECNLSGQQASLFPPRLVKAKKNRGHRGSPRT